MPKTELSETRIALCIVFLLLAPLAGAGLALMNAGLGRLRNAAHAMMAALCVIAIAACAYFVVGNSLHGSAGGAAHVIFVAGKSGAKPWDWLGALPLFFGGLDSANPAAFLTAWMGLVSAGLAALIPLGSGADRWRLGAICASTALLTGLTFPVFAHWTWGGGWLAELGTNYGLGSGYLDAGGSGPIHAVGGLTALAITWIIGPRRGKYTSDGMPMAIPGHNAVFVIFGCFLSLIGWVCLNSAGALLFFGVETGRVVLIAVNTLLGASGAALAAAVVTRAKYGKPDASLTANGWTAGLAAIAAGCCFVHPAAALLTGLIAGGMVTFAVELLDLRVEVDDPGGSISVHAMGGIWGVIALGLFGRSEAAGAGQLFAQVVGVATLIGFVLPLTWGLNALLNLRLKQRVGPEGEHQGMDLYELGAGAYPEFVSHSDDYSPR
jgi:Amt family ammonium transporter